VAVFRIDNGTSSAPDAVALRRDMKQAQARKAPAPAPKAPPARLQQAPTRAQPRALEHP
jgi:hypothetical protein